MSGRLEREPTEVTQAYVICSLCVSHTHAHTQAQSRKKKKLVWGRLSYLSCDASYSSLQFTESLAFRNLCFYPHVCAESALEIIYGFKNTDIVHSFGVILLNLFWGFLIHLRALSWMWRQCSLERAFCVCACCMVDLVLTGSGVLGLNWTDSPAWINSWSCGALLICPQWEAPGQVLQAGDALMCNTVFTLSMWGWNNDVHANGKHVHQMGAGVIVNCHSKTLATQSHEDILHPKATQKHATCQLSLKPINKGFSGFQQHFCGKNPTQVLTATSQKTPEAQLPFLVSIRMLSYVPNIPIFDKRNQVATKLSYVGPEH